MSDWAAVQDFVRDLGEAIAARDHGELDPVQHTAVAVVLNHATNSVLDVVNAPRDEATRQAAHDALELTRHVLALLHCEVARSREVSARSAELRRRARSLIAESLTINRR